MRSGPTARSAVPPRHRRFPDERVEPVDIEDIADVSHVELSLSDDNAFIDGSVAGLAMHIRVALHSQVGRDEGVLVDVAVDLSWHIDDNPRAHSEPMAEISGIVGDEPVDLRGYFRLHPISCSTQRRIESGKYASSVS